MLYNRYMRLFLLLMFLCSCGKPNNNCIGREEAIFKCKAEVSGRWYPIQASQYELTQCERTYPTNSCY
jgi:translation initiation factor 2 beta subunit (eIF-2beta)/eIF-5